jgi:hypothetical protein
MPLLPYVSPGWALEKIEGPRKIEYPFLNSASPDKYARKITRGFSVGGTHTPRLAERTSYTNLRTYSEDYSNAVWTVTELTRTAAALANPWDGVLSFSRFLETSATDLHLVTSSFTFTAAAHTVSALVAGGLGRNYVALRAFDGTNAFQAFFDLTTVTVFSSAGNLTATIVEVGGGVCRISIKFTAQAGAGSVSVRLSTNGSTTTYAGDTAKGLYLGGVQVEQASTPGPYISTTSASRTISAPDVDAIANSSAQGIDYFAYQVAESDPDNVNSSLARFTRSYARIPATQYEPDSFLMVRPPLHDLVSGSTYAVSFDDGRTSHLFTARKTASISTAPDVPNITLGANRGVLPANITITVVGDAGTYTFETDDSESTIRTALQNAMGVANTCMITIDPYEISAAVNTNTLLDSITAASSAVRISGPPNSFTITAADANTSSDRTISSTAHGGAAGDQVAIWNGDKLITTTRVIAVTADTITVPLADLPGADAVVTHIQFADTSATRIANGPIDCSARVVRRFYLPGVTTGISSQADIPGFAPVTADPVSWLAAVVSYLAAPSSATWVVHATERVRSWSGPILEKQVVEIQMQDAIQSLAVGA